jgi:hypothetical protein
MAQGTGGLFEVTWRKSFHGESHLDKGVKHSVSASRQSKSRRALDAMSLESSFLRLNDGVQESRTSLTYSVLHRLKKQLLIFTGNGFIHVKILDARNSSQYDLGVRIMRPMSEERSQGLVQPKRLRGVDLEHLIHGLLNGLLTPGRKRRPRTRNRGDLSEIFLSYPQSGQGN